MKQTSLTFLTWKMIPGGGGKGRGGDGTVALWHCDNKSSTQLQAIWNIVKQCKLFSLLQKAAVSDLPKR